MCAWLNTLAPLPQTMLGQVEIEGLPIATEGTKAVVEASARRFFQQNLHQTPEGRWLLRAYLRSDRMHIHYIRDWDLIEVELDDLRSNAEARRTATKLALRATLPPEITEAVAQRL